MVDFPGLRPRYVSSWSPALRHGHASASRRSSHPSVSSACPTSSQARPLQQAPSPPTSSRPSRHLLSKHQQCSPWRLPCRDQHRELKGPTMKNILHRWGTSLALLLLLCSVGAAQVITGSVQLSQDLRGSLVADAAGKLLFPKQSPLAVTAQLGRPPNRLRRCLCYHRQLHRLQRSSNCLYRSCGYHLQPTIRHCTTLCCIHFQRN